MSAVSRLANHTGNELALMLSQTKPLAWFVFLEELEDDLLSSIEDQFDAYVEAGLFIKKSYTEKIDVEHPAKRSLTAHTLLYALASESWRIPAMKLVIATNQKTTRAHGPAPDEAIDRMMGALLGYSDNEIDLYIAQGNYLHAQELKANG